MARSVVIMLLCVASLAFGGQIQVTSNAELSAANSAAVAGDTIVLHGGTYTTAIHPDNPGVVYMNHASEVCSLYTATSSCVIVHELDGIIVQGLRLQMGSHNDYVVAFKQSSYSALINCYVYGGAYRNNSGWAGDVRTVSLDSVPYFRCIGNVVDRQDNVVLTTSDTWRGDGIVVSGTTSRWFIIEGNTVKNCSHYGISAPYGTGSSDINGIIRNNIIYDCHVGYGAINLNVRSVVEGNRIYSPSQMTTYRSGNAVEMTSQKSIFRYNMCYDDSIANGTNSTGMYFANGSMTQASYALDIENRYYGNAFLGASRNAYKWHTWAAVSDAGMSAYDQGRSVFINNIFGPPVNGYLSVPYYWKDQDNGGVDRDTLRYNIFWTGIAEDTLFNFDYGSSHYYSLSNVTAAEPTVEASNIETDPLFVDMVHLRGSRSFQLSALSPAIDVGRYLTRVNGNVNSTDVIVEDASYFKGKWGPYDGGDSVMIGSLRRLVDSVDYTANKLILHSAANVSDDDAVNVLATYSSQTGTYTTRLYGSAPDIGPYEYPSGEAPAIPDTVSVISPTYGSTQLQPTILRWNRPAGATLFRLSTTIDNWAHYTDIYPSDTLYSMGGYPADTTVKWNVKAGNSSGWSAWNSDWMYYTAAASPVTDTTKVNWNLLTTTKTMQDDTHVAMQNVQRVSTYLVLRNPSHYSVTWPSEIIWPGLSSAPLLTDTVGVYEFVRDSSRVYGFVKKNTP